MGPTVPKLGGKNLPEGPLSALMETKVRERLQRAYEAEAKEKGVPLDQVEKANNLYIREISVMDTVHLVKPGFQRRYGGDGNYPADFPVRSKAKDPINKNRRRREPPSRLPSLLVGGERAESRKRYPS
ncbi:unnamed protein product [Ascophyllum nodosum]